MKLDMMLEDWQKFIRDDIGKEQWIIVYSNIEDESNVIDFYCALIPNEMVNDVLNDPSCDLLIGKGFPGFIKCVDTNEIKYFRFGDENGIEPLVFCRYFHGMKNPYEEISEEFRHYHNLYYDKKNNKYIKIENNGDEDDVVVFQENQIRIKLKYIKEFLSAKKMHLAIYFDLFRLCDSSLEELGVEETSRIIKENNYIYKIFVSNKGPLLWGTDKKSFSSLLGKKLIGGLKDFRPKSWGNRKEGEHIDFIIDVDEQGKEVCYTCDPSKVGYHSRPNYLTPVFFKKKVLTKYYANPEKYSIEDNFLRCGALWGVPLDNNHEKYIIVFLGDLGRYLPLKEQIYWKSFNVPPDGNISSTTFRRSFLGQFADPTQKDLLFKYRFEIFQRKWFEKFGWHLFKPLSDDDDHYYKSLRIPLVNDQAEFDQQVLALAKILVDSLNEDELERLITVERGDKSIKKLEKFLKSNKQVDCDRHIIFLRNLQKLRSSGVAHRKSRNYERISKIFHINDRDLRDVFLEILEISILLLDYLENRFLE